MPDQWLSASQAAARLGVKPETLYAYVSRGLLTSQPVGKGRRGSRYDRAEIERLAARARRGGRAGALEVLVDTGLTLLEPEGRLYYRGWNVTDAARVASYERVAEWLWTGVDDGEPPPWRCSEHALEVATACTTHLPDSATLVDRMRVAIAAVATTDPLRHDRRPEAVVMAGRALVAALVDCLPRLGSGAKSSIPALDVGSRPSPQLDRSAPVVPIVGSSALGWGVGGHQHRAGAFGGPRISGFHLGRARGRQHLGRSVSGGADGLGRVGRSPPRCPLRVSPGAAGRGERGDVGGGSRRSTTSIRNDGPGARPRGLSGRRSTGDRAVGGARAGPATSAAVGGRAGRHQGRRRAQSTAAQCRPGLGRSVHVPRPRARTPGRRSSPWLGARGGWPMPSRSTSTGCGSGPRAVYVGPAAARGRRATGHLKARA